jgi:hypothetical protein
VGRQGRQGCGCPGEQKGGGLVKVSDLPGLADLAGLWGKKPINTVPMARAKNKYFILTSLRDLTGFRQRRTCQVYSRGCDKSDRPDIVTPQQKSARKKNQPRAVTFWQTPAQAKIGTKKNGKGRCLAVPVW